LKDEKKLSTVSDIKKDLFAAYPELEKICLSAIRESMIENGFSFKKIAKYHEQLHR